MWSRGVELTRQNAVVGSLRRPDEIEVRLATAVGVPSATVLLFVDEGDWTCDCDSPEEVCAHVAAAVISLHQAAQRPTQAAAVPALAQVAYAFSRQPGGLALQLMVDHAGVRTPLPTSLVQLSGAAQAARPWRLAPTRVDLSVEARLGTAGTRPPSQAQLQHILHLLEGHSAVSLDGVPMQVAPEQPLLHIEIKAAAGGGVRVHAQQSSEIAEIFANGVVRMGTRLAAVGQLKLASDELARLRAGILYSAQSLGMLVQQDLPRLRAHLPVQISCRLPEPIRLAPRLQLHTEAAGQFLRVAPRLVYGQPAIAHLSPEGLQLLGKSQVPIRDLKAEADCVQALKDALDLVPNVPQVVQGSAAAQLAQRLVGWQGGEVTGNGLAQFRPAAPLGVRLEVAAGGQLEAHFESAEGSRLAPEAALAAWRAGEACVQVGADLWAPLPLDWLAKHGERLLSLYAERDGQTRLPARIWPELAALCADTETPLPPDMDALCAALADRQAVPAAPLPADLSVPLRPYQRQGVDWLVLLGNSGLGALLADDMGLGKTLQALCALRGRSLVVAPTSVLSNWMQEAARFRPQLRCALYHGAGRSLDPEADLVLTSYALLRLDQDRLRACAWETLVLDEAHLIKNPDSQVARAAFSMRANRRIALTGTPVENRLAELWSQEHFLNPGLLGSRQHFEQSLAQPIAQGDAQAAARLSTCLRPFVLRRRKADVAPELPPRTEMVLSCSLSADERALYDSVRAATRAEVLRTLGVEGNLMGALEALLRLRQACCHSGLLPGQTAQGSTKLSCLLEALGTAQAEGHRALVFSQWTGLLDRVAPALTAAGLSWGRVDGSTRDRGQVVADFQRSDGPDVLLMSLKAGGVGLNLTAADHVYILDPWWNPAAEDQAADRAHRIGQNRPVFIYRLVAEDTVETRILALQARKRALAESAWGAGGAALSRDELMALLNP